MHPLQNLPIYELNKIFKDEPDETLAKRIIREFYKVYLPDEAEIEAWATTTIVMQTDNEKADSHERSNALYFFEHFKILNGAVAYLDKLHTDKYEGEENTGDDDDEDNDNNA